MKGPISVPALIQVFEKMPRPSPGIELWAIITSLGSTRLDSFCTSKNIKRKKRENVFFFLFCCVVLYFYKEVKIRRAAGTFR